MQPEKYPIVQPTRCLAPDPSRLAMTSGFRARSCLGFTLLELIVVMAIIGVLSALVIPSLNSLLKGSQIAQAGQMLGDELNLARQTALSTNNIIEVRFYQYADPEVPGDKDTNAGKGKFRAFQDFVIQASGTAVALGKIQRLPTSMIIDSGTALSTLLGDSTKKSWSGTDPSDTDPKKDPKVMIPRVGTTYECRAFRFLPGGSTNLMPQTKRWFLTVHSFLDVDALENPPRNFHTIQIDATNAHIKSYRP